MIPKPVTIHIPEGNAFALICPIKSRYWQGVAAIDTNIDATMLTDIVVKVNGNDFTDFEATAEGVVLSFGSDLARGVYNITIAAKYNEIAIRAAYFEAFDIVEWSFQSDYENFVPESPLVAEAAYCVAGNWTDAQLEQLKQAYIRAIAAAERAKEEADAAKAEWEQKIEELDNVAKETTSQQILTEIGDLNEIIEAINGDTVDNIVDDYLDGEAEEIEEIIGNWNNE